MLAENPNHAKVLQQLGWLYHQQNAAFVNQEQAIGFLTRSIEADGSDAQSWYLMGRCYMAQQKYNKAYEAYQQAVYRDSKNPTFWCSIGLLYFQINQYRDALDAYSKAIRINPNISEVWFDLGALYEACNNQVSDAIDAYQRASDLDPENPHIKERLAYLRHGGPEPGGPPAPYPGEMNPNGYPHNTEGLNGHHAFSQVSITRHTSYMSYASKYRIVASNISHVQLLEIYHGTSGSSYRNAGIQWTPATRPPCSAGINLIVLSHKADQMI